MKFLPALAEEILIQNIWTKYGSWLNILFIVMMYRWRHNVSQVQTC